MRRGFFRQRADFPGPAGRARTLPPCARTPWSWRRATGAGPRRNRWSLAGVKYPWREGFKSAGAATQAAGPEPIAFEALTSAGAKVHSGVSRHDRRRTDELATGGGAESGRNGADRARNGYRAPPAR